MYEQVKPLLGERCRACRGGEGYYFLFVSKIPLSVTLTGDSSPLGEPFRVAFTRLSLH